MWLKKLKLLSTFSQLRFWLSPKQNLFFQSRTTSRKLSIGNPMEDFRLLVTKKKQFEVQDFTMSKASFGGIGESEFQINDRSIWLCNQVCLLKCKGFYWHSDGINRNWDDLEPTGFSIQPSLINVNFFCNLFRINQSLIYGEKQVWPLMWIEKLNFLSTFNQFRFRRGPKKFLVQRWATGRIVSISRLMEDFRLVVTKKELFECHFFTISIACFGRIGKPQLQNRYRSIWMCNQVCLLKCKGFDWHWDGTNQNWVDLGQNDFEYGDIILTIKTLLGIFRVKFFWCKVWNWWFSNRILL